MAAGTALEHDIANQNPIEQDMIVTNSNPVNFEEVHSPAPLLNIEGGKNNTYNVNFSGHIVNVGNAKRMRTRNTMLGAVKRGKYSNFNG